MWTYPIPRLPIVMFAVLLSSPPIEVRSAEFTVSPWCSDRNPGTPAMPQVFVHRMPHKLASVNESLEFIVDPILLRASNTIVSKAAKDMRVDLVSLATMFR